ncbi:MAG: sodium/proline symporter [Zetaproteobacteria bacterium CG12_big_fil_rev_8_21_14_0_65_54_13]|nr:MAG: sodium:proline symporter [Zetaproteobacteria bacterium CG23_combo_of_CG06-09_8_20_14_all_54_7]PIW44498.1 MAG: sodium/proline symporter [Zetaproteobacteria bacterium CG12_big_fil_rev_8_21_14_0_65_54_13]PIX53216.1 MAG: sodium/proline symporter [Zetaproteobacteria bacterium CG_4_10_14_3_um_filter_54_28]PJA30594.1 MAG: sodium/proline symporter [Zetaproteobacteria bacterium CG_4_9_14_3_um_filter_54_145]
MAIISFIVCLSLFAAIGALSMLKRQPTTGDYLIAGRSVPPWLAGLSAVATNNSGYMFIGMIGLTYTTGLSSIWLMIGWLAGDLTASLLIMKKLRETSETEHVQSFGGLLAQWHGTDYTMLRRLCGALTTLFLGAYAAAQFTAGSKALHVLFGWDLSTGAILGAALVLLYSYSGGIRASIWTDAAQSFVMLGAMLALMSTATASLGSGEEISAQLIAVSPEFMHWFPDTSWLGVLLFIAGWVFAGFGVAGQPHIVVRYMALDRTENLGRFRVYYYTWFTLFYAATIVVGLLARLILPDAGSFDAELALPMMSMQLLPEIWVGLVLAGLFAATMSTADSLVLSCSASVTSDLFPERNASYKATKAATAGIVLIALGLSLSGNHSVLALVLVAWGLLATAFVPLLTVYVMGGRPSERLALLMVTGGVAVFLLWRWSGLSATVYEVLPGMLAGLLIFMAYHYGRKRLPV